MSIPVRALESTEPFCTLDHVHDQSCPTSAADEGSAPNLSGVVLHRHNEFCRDAAGNLICPLEEVTEHVHGEACYELRMQETLPQDQGHVHADACYTDVRCGLICTVPEQVGHTHSEECYEAAVPDATEEPHDHTQDCYALRKGELTCVIPEFEGHAHGQACYIFGEELICGAEENEEHSHQEDCYGKTLICQTPEDIGHAHADGCFEWVEVLACTEDKTSELNRIVICTEEERPGHAHSDACYEWARALSCGMEELPAGSSVPKEPEKVLICPQMELTNHVHAENCYETDSAGAVSLTCNQQQLEEHQHTASCLGFRDAELLCTQEENEAHQHDYTCYRSWSFLCQTAEEPADTPIDTPVEIPEEQPTEKPEEEAEPDPYADDETRKQWEKTFAHVDLTGAWSYDLLAIAQTQLGYEESVHNYIVAENGDRKGYTRYGDWFGFKYGDWCAMFVSFCLDYAGVENFPLHCNCNRWIEELEAAGLYISAGAYMPRPGDIVFLDYGYQSTGDQTLPVDADHVAIVAEIVPAAEDEAAKIITIEGNHNNCVCYETRGLDDTKIIGYGRLPDGPAAVYSCAMQVHAHDVACFDEDGVLACQMREHIHDEICRSRKLRYAEETFSVDVMLSNAVYLPEDLQLDVSLIRDLQDPACAAMTKAVDKVVEDSYVLTDGLIFKMGLLADGEEFQLPVGVQADVTIAFAQPVTSQETAEQYILMLVEKGSAGPLTNQKKKKSKKTASYEALELITDNYGNTDAGIQGLHFASNRISAVAIAFAGVSEENEA